MDKLSPAERSKVMACVPTRNTKPELVVRRVLSDLGFRYRTHCKNLPGSPDLANATRQIAIFVHGCFWHRHPGCKRATMPASNVDYWEQKFARNVERDKQCIKAYKAMGWRVAIVWECETKNHAKLTTKLRRLIMA